MTFDDLELRGLVKQVTNKDAVKNLIDSGKAVFYIGFDPTNDSLLVGHLLQLMTAQKLIQAGNKCIILLGTATAQIGDPTGKSESRNQLELGETKINANKIMFQINQMIGDPDWKTLKFEDNSIWFSKLSFMKFITDIGKHFSVHQMLNAKCFKSRIEAGGLSFLEFSYMLMQGFDFLHLTNLHECNLQVGGDDQWSNILAGIDLNSIKNKKETFGLTLPLLVDSNNVKMGKTTKGAVFLDKEKTSVFDFFQFWRNVPDQDFVNLKNILSQDPNNFPTDINSAKKQLACELTEFVHGKEELETVLQQIQSIFESKDLKNIKEIVVPKTNDFLKLLVQCKLVKSKTEARKAILNKGIKLNSVLVDNPEIALPEMEKDDFSCVLSMGKKKIIKVKFGES